MVGLPENNAASTTAHNTTVLNRRLQKVWSLEGAATATGVSLGIGGKSNDGPAGVEAFAALKLPVAGYVDGV
jgi:hypothetical protein